MKILRLNFKNLASLVGEWSINFADKELSKNGIFAIIGDTASGKTTIFDAVCLALYGLTPRLTNAFSEKNNEIINIGEKECFAEVIFETEINGNQDYYRFRWSQKRTQRSSKSSFGAVKHEVFKLQNADDKVGQQISSLKSKTEEQAEKLTGLNLTQFTQAAMLSQGKFTKFLEAGHGERAFLLEKITGTSIYRRIAAKAHELKSDANSQEKELKEHINILTQQTANLNVAELESQKKKLDIENNKLNEKEQKLIAACAWRQGIIELENKKKKLLNEKQQLDTACKEFAPQHSRLERALKALELAEAAAKLKHARDIVSANEKNKADNEKELNRTIEQKEKAQEQVSIAASELEAAQNQDNELRSKLSIIRPIDARIATQEQLVLNAQNEIADAEKALEQAKAAYSDSNSELIKIDNELSVHDKYINDNAADEELQSILSGINSDKEFIRKQLPTKLEKDKNKNQLENDIKKALGEQSEATQKAGATANELEKISGALDQYIKERGTESEKFAGKDPAQTVIAINSEAQRMNEAFKCCQDWLECQEQLVQYQNNIEQAETKATQLKEQIDSQKKLCDSLADAIDNAQKFLDAQNKLDALVDSLRESEACPLCGSMAHPHPHEKSADTLQTEAKIAANRAAKKEAEELLEELKKKLADNNSAISTNKSFADKAQITLDKLQLELAPWEKELAIDAICPDNASLWHSTLQDACKKIKQKKEILESAHKKLQKLEKDITDLQNKKTELEKEQYKQNSIITSSQQLIEANNATLETFKEELNAIEQGISEKRRSIAEILSKFHCHLPEHCTLNVLDNEFAGLCHRSKLYKEHKDKSAELTPKKTALSADLENKEKLVKKASEDLQKRAEEQGKLTKVLQDLKKQRLDIFGEQNADVAEQQMRNRLEVKQNNHASAEKETARLQTLIKEKQTALDNLAAELLKNQKSAREFEQQFSAKLRDKGFNNEEDYAASVLTEDEIAELNKQKDELARQSAQINGLIDENSNNLQQEQQKNLSDLKLDDLENELSTVKQTLADNRESLGGIEKSFELIEKNTKEIDKLNAQLEQHKSKLTHFEKLKNLLGNQDGSTFNSFAQGITFELLLDAANRHLQNFSDRYILHISDSDNMVFVIIDTMQGNAIRTPSNLSGGEKFLVSLSLALGLSELASEKVSIDTLFIDEGFGTLSEDYLNTVLNALTTLKNDNKTIGVISHVEQLKAVITQHISLRKLGGGISEIITQGPDASPGCRKLS